MSDERAAVAERAAMAGGAVAEASFRGEFEVETKDGDTDYVTETDRAAQETVVEHVREAYPDDVVVGEEEGARSQVPESGPAWVVDPIDGTNNFVRGLRVWATAVAAVVDGEPVAAAVVAPALDDAFLGGDRPPTRNGDPIRVSDVSDPERGTVVPTVWWGRNRRDEYARACEAIVSRFGDLRRLGCAQASLATLAAGSVEGVITNVRCNPWDTVAGVHLVRAAGGTVTDLEGNRWRHDSRGLVASNGALHDEVLAAAREIDGPDATE